MRFLRTTTLVSIPIIADFGSGDTAALTDHRAAYENTYMSSGDLWTFEFYVEADGASPVEDFLDSIDVKTRTRFRWSMEQLRIRNIQARAPLARHLDGDLWELREESNTNIYRIVYFFFTGRRIVFLHGFQKKTQKTPSRELEVARRRHVAFLARYGKG